ncbi:MAG: hypothetical protein ABI162_01700 [Luteolibacter sp.]
MSAIPIRISLPVRIFHASGSGILIGTLISVGVLQFQQSVQATTAGSSFRGNGSSTSASSPGVVVVPATADDLDGDGIRNTWETANCLDPSKSGDAASDFDFDGLTAKQEYDLSVQTNGQYGNPLGKFQCSDISPPPDYTLLSALTLVETAKNGICVVRVQGVRTDASVSSVRIYTYNPANQQWTYVLPPSTAPATTILTATDVNSKGQVVGRYYNSGTKGFIWTPSATPATGGESNQFFINPTTSHTSAIPVRISDTGYLLYATPPTGTLHAADYHQRPIVPLANSWTNPQSVDVNDFNDFGEYRGAPQYVDVNDYGEYVGIIRNPVTYEMNTFLAMPDGPFYLSELSNKDFQSNGIVAVPDVDCETIQWIEPPTFVYPDDYYDAEGNFHDPYEDYVDDGYSYGTAVDATTHQTVQFRRDFTSN